MPVESVHFILTRDEVTISLVNEVAVIMKLNFMTGCVKCLGCDGLPFPFLVLFCFISLKVAMSVIIDFGSLVFW